uniref:ORF2 n=1 Tax=Torque teno Leptonychotes weddellii virus-1 TaxID=2012676 RepID=A0A1Z2RVE6_9VIRU|nr:ORF2 [Torque teno Leptonychotes weddellii virus 1]
MCAAPASPGDPDLHHPLQYKRREALWKRDCSLRHSEFCACGDYLLHFKWSSGGVGIGGQEGPGGAEREEPDTGGESIIGATGGGEEEDYIQDSELLQ